jgi:UDP-N-acetylglucosamine 2-epimerase (non-hydrolysing)/UDP-GlcNAc3NAcA epimerase
VQRVTVFDYVIWPETMVDNANQLAKANRNDILEKLSTKIKWDDKYQPFGAGDAAGKIVEAMENKYGIS